jgi:Flp pilus assembly protein TadG
MVAMWTKVRDAAAAGLRVAIRWTLAGRLVCAEDGAATIEFAIVSVPFLALLFGILETAFVFFADQALGNAAAVAGRLIMTGQAQANQTSTGAPMTASQFTTAACAAISGFFNCTTNLIVDVQTYSTFSTANSGSATSLPLNTNGVLQINPRSPNFNMGGPGSIVIVRLMYQWPVWVKLPGLTSMMDMASGTGQPLTGRLLMATSVFVNEPYSSGS